MDKKFIISLNGKEFIKFEGLLDIFHKNGGKNVQTQLLKDGSEDGTVIVQATVHGEKGTFMGIGDANDKNVNRMVVPHKIRMAETRAIARALRWYNNIGMCSADELGENKDYKPGKKVQIQKKEFNIIANMLMETGAVSDTKEYVMENYETGGYINPKLKELFKTYEQDLGIGQDQVDTIWKTFTN